jgi:hypothetical protein
MYLAGSMPFESRHPSFPPDKVSASVLDDFLGPLAET